MQLFALVLCRESFRQAARLCCEVSWEAGPQPGSSFLVEMRRLAAAFLTSEGFITR